MKSRLTWVYLIKDNAEVDCYKIGQSRSPEDRLVELTNQGTKQARPNDYELIEAWWCDQKWEPDLHTYFNRYRVRGEWFILNEPRLAELYAALIRFPKHSTPIDADANPHLQAALTLFRDMKFRMDDREEKAGHAYNLGNRVQLLEHEVSLLKEQIKALKVGPDGKKPYDDFGSRMKNLPSLSKRSAGGE